MPSFGMQRSIRQWLIALSITSVISASAYAAGDISTLELFKGNNMQSGKWRVELLSTSDTKMQDAMAKMGNMSICADVAKELAKNSKADHSDCNTKIIRNSSSVAEVEAICKDGNSHMTITRENKDSFLLDGTMTSKDEKPKSMKMRYTYQGACKSDGSVIQMDKNSEACQKMKAQMGGHDMTAMCASSPEQYRAQCEQQMKNMMSMCE